MLHAVHWKRGACIPPLVVLLVLFGGQCGGFNGQEFTEKVPVRMSLTDIDPDWQELFPEHHPSRRAAVQMTYDSRRKRVVLFGGENSHPDWTLFNDTWEFDGRDWVEIAVESPPPIRSRGAMVYCRGWDMTILFGGATFGTALADTWVYQNKKWRQLNPAHAPAARREFGMCFDEHRGLLLLYGGENHITFVNYRDLWAFDGNDWTMLGDNCPPASRTIPLMVYDSARRKTVLHGGSIGMSYFNDTWEYDGDWVKINTPTQVLPRRGRATGCYDRYRGKTIMQGGGIIGTSYYDTWEYDGEDWRKINTTNSPKGAGFSAMAYMDATYKSIRFGAQAFPFHDETWAYSGVIVGAPAVSPPAVGLLLGLLTTGLTLATLKRRCRTHTDKRERT